MPSDGHGSTIVVNGQSSILDAGNSVLTLENGQHITANVVGATSAYVLAPGETLTPGAVLTVDGTTFGMPADASGSVVVINGITSTLPHGASITAAPALTIDGQTYSHTVRDGTTEYVIRDGTTLVPGGVITMDGTTYSLDDQGTALVVNGQTSSIQHASIPASNSASATTSNGASTTSVRRVIGTSGTENGDRPAQTSEGAGVSSHGKGIAGWVESLLIGVAGWVVVLL
jgi:hypothetical protein